MMMTLLVSISYVNQANVNLCIFFHALYFLFVSNMIVLIYHGLVISTGILLGTLEGKNNV